MLYGFTKQFLEKKFGNKLTMFWIILVATFTRNRQTTKFVDFYTFDPYKSHYTEVIKICYKERKQAMLCDFVTI